MVMRAARRFAQLQTDPTIAIVERGDDGCRLVRPVNRLDPAGASLTLRVQRLGLGESWVDTFGVYDCCLTFAPGPESWEGSVLASDVVTELCRRHPRPVWWAALAPSAPGRAIPAAPLTIRKRVGYVTTATDALVALTA